MTMNQSRIASLARCKCGRWTSTPWRHVGCEVLIRGSLNEAPKFDALPTRANAPKRKIVESIAAGAKTLLKLKCGHMLVRYASRGRGFVPVHWARCMECHAQ